MRRNTRGAQLGGGDHKLVGLPQRVCAKALTLGSAAATGHLAPILRPCATHGGRKLGAGTASSKICHKGSVHNHLHSGQPLRPADLRPSCAPAQHTGGASWGREQKHRVPCARADSSDGLPTQDPTTGCHPRPSGLGTLWGQERNGEVPLFQPGRDRETLVWKNGMGGVRFGHQVATRGASLRPGAPREMPRLRSA